MIKINMHKALFVLIITCIVGMAVGSTAAQSTATYNYGEALQKSIYFYEHQQSGVLPEWNRVSWRADSSVGDGIDVGVDLSGGWYDAGDHIKFGFPMAASATMLAWGGLEFQDGFVDSGQLVHLENNLRFVNDYFLNAFANDEPGAYEFYAQVGKKSDDHVFWGSAEVLDYHVAKGSMERPSYKIDTANPGSDIAAETAAAMASSSILFRMSGDTDYADLLLTQAEKLYTFADEYRGMYHESVPEAECCYKSWGGYQDELVWGAIWLHKANVAQDAAYGDSYLVKAETEWEFLEDEQQMDGTKKFSWTHDWDGKDMGSHSLLAELTGDDKYHTAVRNYLDFQTVGAHGKIADYSPGGLMRIFVWGPIRYSINGAFIHLHYANLLEETGGDQAIIDRGREFTRSQIDYALGDNPEGLSYMIGFGDDYPLNPHHRTSYGTWIDLPLSGDDYPELENNRHILYGALVGGPDQDDNYTDDRNEFQLSEVADDYNAAFTGVMAWMYSEYGGDPIPEDQFPPQEVAPPDEIFIEAVAANESDQQIDVKMYIRNTSAWPARGVELPKVRYYFTVEGDISGVTAGINYSNCNTLTGPHEHEAPIYYIEIDCFSDAGDAPAVIYPGGQDSDEHQRDIQFRINNSAGWDSTNDWSYDGMVTGASTAMEMARNIVLLDDDVVVWGNVPGGGAEPLPTEMPTEAPTETPVPTEDATESPTEMPVTLTPAPTETSGGEPLAVDVMGQDAADQSRFLSSLLIVVMGLGLMGMALIATND